MWIWKVIYLYFIVIHLSVLPIFSSIGSLPTPQYNIPTFSLLLLTPLTHPFFSTPFSCPILLIFSSPSQAFLSHPLYLVPYFSLPLSQAFILSPPSDSLLPSISSFSPSLSHPHFLTLCSHGSLLPNPSHP